MSEEEPMEPCISFTSARRLVASFKGHKIVRVETLNELIQSQDLPWHPDPYGSDAKVFLPSELRSWWQERLQAGRRPMRGPGRGPGRPPKLLAPSGLPVRNPRPK
jgi:hypothetical protein